MGSMLRERGITTRMGTESMEAHRDIHTAYRNAGATIAVADTFGSTPLRRGHAHKLSLQPDPAGMRFGPVYTQITRDMVEIARTAFGEGALVAGSIAPITDTSGRHDVFWEKFPPHERLGYLMDRHAPQLNALLDGGADMILGEAFRYVEEAEAVVSVAREFGARAVAVCFEANRRGLPFHLEGNPTSFRDLKNNLKNLAGDMPVWVGANCTGMSVIRSILEGGDELDLLYANSLDFNGEQAAYAGYVDMKERGDPEASRIEALHTTPITDYASFARWAFERGVKVVGGCCGTTPETTRAVRVEWDQFLAEQSRSPQARDQGSGAVLNQL